MKETRLMMDMPITVEIVDNGVTNKSLSSVFDYFQYVDNTFSTFKDTSEISHINKGILPKNKWSKEMTEIFTLCEETKNETGGYFNIRHNNIFDPSGLVKGWAIQNAASQLQCKGFTNYYIDAGGDVEVHGLSDGRNMWRVGIRNPFNRYENIKILELKNCGIATSGTYIRGSHIYNPHNSNDQLNTVVSLTVVSKNVYEADRFATAAFAMGEHGVEFIENLPGFEAYQINSQGVATYTSGFTRYVAKA